ncbi:hypothetical protein A4X13_0g261 [Tilletia indica]|uniref:Uncharacterized protein n=1 Tax=Tilletia indica TaxID=43049 RepID=A0A177TKU4_9BASI|nr:hypothetical protein A4X13_0g261 [Tilletia indica]
MTSNYNPVTATNPDPPTSIRDSSSKATTDASQSSTYISSSSNANTAAETDKLTSSSSAERKGETVTLGEEEAQGVREQDVVKEGKEDVGLGEGGCIQID